MATSDDLRQIFTAGRPLIEEWLDIGEQIAALRDVAASKGLDWSQLKALMKAQVQDERDETGNGKRVARIVEKAEFASAYADMLGLANMNENNFSAGQSYAEVKGVKITPSSGDVFADLGVERPAHLPAHNRETGEILTQEQPVEPATKSGVGPLPVETASEGPHVAVTAGETAPIPHSPAYQASQALQADKTSEAALSSTASLAPPNGTKHTNTGYGSDSLHDVTGQVGAVPSLDAPAILSDDDVPAFLRAEQAGKKDCLKLKDGHCRISFATGALCSDCANARTKARAGV